MNTEQTKHEEMTRSAKYAASKVPSDQLQDAREWTVAYLQHVEKRMSEEKADHDEWEWQMKQDKIEQNHDFLGERDNQENEEA